MRATQFLSLDRVRHTMFFFHQINITLIYKITSQSTHILRNLSSSHIQPSIHRLPHTSTLTTFHHHSRGLPQREYCHILQIHKIHSFPHSFLTSILFNCIPIIQFPFFYFLSSSHISQHCFDHQYPCIWSRACQYMVQE